MRILAYVCTRKLPVHITLYVYTFVRIETSAATCTLASTRRTRRIVARLYDFVAYVRVCVRM